MEFVNFHMHDYRKHYLNVNARHFFTVYRISSMCCLYLFSACLCMFVLCLWHCRSHMLNKCLPPSARPARPIDIFHYHSKRSQTMTGPGRFSNTQQQKHSLPFSCKQFLFFDFQSSRMV